MLAKNKKISKEAALARTPLVGCESTLVERQLGSARELPDFATMFSGKSAGRRKLLDKQAWKILKKLYPTRRSWSRRSVKCLHCTMEGNARMNEIVWSMINSNASGHY
jgi:hypothetical protein